MTYTTYHGYHGYTNRETWLVALWIDNDQTWLESLLDALREESVRRGEEAADEGYYSSGELSSWTAGQIVQTEVEEVIFDPVLGGLAAPSGLAADLVADALSAVNWDELGENYLTTLREQS